MLFDTDQAILLKFCLEAYFFINLISYSMEKNKQTLSDAEIELLKEGLKRSYKERFEMATRLYKIQQTMSKATIVHKPFISK